MIKNENTNLRIKALLTEFLNPEFGIENVRPYSPSQQDLLRIYEEGVLNSILELPEDIGIILGKFNQTDTLKRPNTPRKYYVTNYGWSKISFTLYRRNDTIK